jgi:predicted aspartyl protease
VLRFYEKINLCTLEAGYLIRNGVFCPKFSVQPLLFRGLELMSFTRIFIIITLLVCLSTANFGAKAYSGVDENDLAKFSDQQPMGADKADSQTKSLARIDLPAQRPTETKFVRGQHMRVPVKIVYNGKIFRTLFELDTGATHTVVSQEFAKKLQIQKRPFTGSGSLAGVKVSASAFKVSSIMVGPIERKNHQILILHSNQKGWSKLKGLNILGMDLLKDTPFSVDYQAGVIRWGNHPAHRTQYQIKTKAIIKDVRVLLPVDIVYKGQTFSKLFVLDTGAAQTSVTPMFARILGVTNVSQGRWVKISRIKAGPLELKDHRIAIWDAPDNLIGMDLLQYVNFTIDYQAGVIRWNL